MLEKLVKFACQTYNIAFLRATSLIIFFFFFFPVEIGLFKLFIYIEVNLSKFYLLEIMYF